MFYDSRCPACNGLMSGKQDVIPVKKKPRIDFNYCKHCGTKVTLNKKEVNFGLGMASIVYYFEKSKTQ